MEKPTHFIVVDDDPINNMLCRLTIGKYFPDANITTFEKPEVALDIIQESYSTKEQKQTLLFLDINMPSMTAWDFMQQFNHFGEDIHRQFLIYILSSSVDRRDMERAGNCHFVSGYISKPLSREKMGKLIEELETPN